MDWDAVGTSYLVSAGVFAGLLGFYRASRSREFGARGRLSIEAEWKPLAGYENLIVAVSFENLSRRPLWIGSPIVTLAYSEGPEWLDRLEGEADAESWSSPVSHGGSGRLRLDPTERIAVGTGAPLPLGAEVVRIEAAIEATRRRLPLSDRWSEERSWRTSLLVNSAGSGASTSTLAQRSSLPPNPAGGYQVPWLAEVNRRISAAQEAASNQARASLQKGAEMELREAASLAAADAALSQQTREQVV